MPAYQCAYCGVVADATDDHIPAKTFFGGALDAPLPSVKACEACNQGASLDDEYLRDTILMYHGTADLPQAQAHIEKMFRALALPRKQSYARATFRRLDSAAATTPAGLYLGTQPVVRVDQVRMQRVIARYARGLHRYHFGERVPADTPMHVIVNPDALHEHSDEFVEGFRGAEVSTLKEGVFWYARMRPRARPTSSYWLLMFFDVFPTIIAMRPDQPFPRQDALAV